MTLKQKPAAAEFAARKPRIFVAIGFFAVLSLFALLMLTAAFFTAREGKYGFSGVLFVTGLLLLIASISSLKHYLVMYGANGPLVAMDSAGFSDCRVIDGIVPWGAMQWWIEGFPDRNKSKLIVLLAPEYQTRIRPRTLVERVFGHDPAAVIISMSGLGTEIAGIASAMERFKPSARLDPRDPNRGVWD